MDQSEASITCWPGEPSCTLRTWYPSVPEMKKRMKRTHIFVTNVCLVICDTDTHLLPAPRHSGCLPCLGLTVMDHWYLEKCFTLYLLLLQCCVKMLSPSLTALSVHCNFQDTNVIDTSLFIIFSLNNPPVL